MSENSTQDIPGGRSFEDRVFARFDSLDARFQTFDTRFQTFDERFQTFDARLQKLEDDAERRALETKPIWERALAEILEVRGSLDAFRGETREALRDLGRKMNVLARDMVQLRADQEHVEGRVETLESKPRS